MPLFDAGHVLEAGYSECNVNADDRLWNNDPRHFLLGVDPESVAGARPQLVIHE